MRFYRLDLCLFQLFILFFPLLLFSSQPLNILFMVKSFPSTTQIFVLNQIAGLLEKGHTITILSRGLREDIHHPLIEQYDLLKKVYVQTLPKNKRNFDIILCQFGSLGRWFFKNKQDQAIRGKVVTFFRGDDIKPWHLDKKSWYAQLFQEGDFFIPVCEFFKQELIKAGCNPEKIEVVHSAVDLRKFNFQTRKLKSGQRVKIVTTGRLIEKKGTEYAIRAVAHLLKQGLDVQLDIIGGGPLEAELQDLIYDLDAAQRIKMHGVCSHEQVIEFLHNAHIFTLPSVLAENGDREGIPNALKEAMAIGLPVVSTNHSGISELIAEGLAGFLVPERNWQALADKLCYLIQHPKKWSGMGKAGRAIIEKNFAMDRENKKLESLLHRIARSN